MANRVYSYRGRNTEVYGEYKCDYWGGGGGIGGTANGYTDLFYLMRRACRPMIIPKDGYKTISGFAYHYSPTSSIILAPGNEDAVHGRTFYACGRYDTYYLPGVDEGLHFAFSESNQRKNTTHALLFVSGLQAYYIEGQAVEKITASRSYWNGIPDGDNDNSRSINQFWPEYEVQYDFQSLPVDYDIVKKLFISPVVLLCSGGVEKFVQITNSSLTMQKNGIYNFNLKCNVQM